MAQEKRIISQGYGIVCHTALLLLSFLFVLLMSFSTSPLYLGYSGDATLYRQMGQLIVNGGIPYVDLCDNKGILLYLFYAAGIAINPHWGLCLLQTVVLASTLVLWERLLGEFLPRGWRIPCLVFVLGLMACFYEGGGLTEELCLPFISLPLLFWIRADNRHAAIPRWQYFVVGLCAGVIAFVRVNNLLVFAGFYAVTFLSLLMGREFRQAFGMLGSLLGGFLAIALLCLGYLFLLGGTDCLLAMWDNMFSLNVDRIVFHKDRSAYLGSPLPHILTVLLAGVGGTLLFRRKWEVAVSCWFSLVCVGLSLWFRPYPHYHIVLLPVYILLIGQLTQWRRWVGVLCMVFLLALHSPPLYGTVLRVRRELLLGRVAFQQGFDNFQCYANARNQSAAPTVFNFESFAGLSLLNSVQWTQCNRNPVRGMDDEFQALVQSDAIEDLPELIILSGLDNISEENRHFIEQHYTTIAHIGEVSWRDIRLWQIDPSSFPRQ